MIIRERPNASLRELEESDLSLILEWRNSKRIRLASIHQNQVSLNEHRTWYERNKNNPGSKLLVFERLHRRMGFVHFFDLNQKQKSGHWGFYIGAEDAPKGSGTLMCEMALEYAFEDLQLESVIGEVLASNLRSQSFHKKFGFHFSEEKVLPETSEAIFEYRCPKKDWQSRAA